MFASCARCQAALDPSDLEGLCPRCLLLQDLPLERVEEIPTTVGQAFVAPKAAELASRFPQLEIVELLGQGGMGAVYKARQVKLDRWVALKVLPPEAAQTPGFAERFLREARTLARLNHPHVVGVYDFGEVQGLYYLLMEFIEGVNLRQALTTGKLAPHQALTIVSELCAALQYAHEMGVVHRDIKPENILLDHQGRVKVADFGLAKLIGPSQGEKRLTATRQAMGTLHYMAPEQWEKPLEVDHRADIYSLGVVFYELLTGELPLGKFPPPSEKAQIDTRLDEVVLRAIEKQPEQRYQQMSEMKSAVEAIEQPPEASRETELVRLNWPFEMLVTLGLVGLVGAVGTGLWLAKPYLKQDEFDNWAILLIFLGAWVFHPSNRYVKRLWGLALVGFSGFSFFCAMTGIRNVINVSNTWLWLCVFCFIPMGVAALQASFRLEGSEEEEEDQPSAPPPGLSETEEALRQRLKQAEDDDEFHSQLSVVPDIDSTLLSSARENCEVPDEEQVLGVLDFSQGEGERGVVFGCQGIYWNNGIDTPHPGTGTLSYAELAKRRFVNHGISVYLGTDLFICPEEEETWISAEQMTRLLYEVSAVMSSPAGSSE